MNRIQLVFIGYFISISTHFFSLVQVTAQTSSLACDEDWWTVGIFNRERLFIKVVTKPPEVWMAHLKLREALLDDATALEFENYFRKLVITMKKPKKGIHTILVLTRVFYSYVYILIIIVHWFIQDDGNQ